ncbi:MAG: U32 family peptidase [Clostridia bacterium]|nr:U32 family peptidase [Clostridia bacterium]
MDEMIFPADNVNCPADDVNIPADNVNCPADDVNIPADNIELLAPAGNFQKMETAFLYGADSVYLGGEAFGLRANAGNFTADEIRKAAKLANSLGKHIYVTVNILARNDDVPLIREYVGELFDAGVHGLIVSDIGIFLMIRELYPDMPLHVSTQANNLNYKTAEFWFRNGASRLNLARELSLQEIKVINGKLLEAMPELGSRKEPVLEAFVHGAMCMAYSGRCMLSDYLAGRSSNRGDCAQPCRWKYYISEEQRPGEYFQVEESDRGTFLFNSKDLAMIRYLPELLSSGVRALKIEGRMKSEFYLATVVKAYRTAIDAYRKNPQGYSADTALLGYLDNEIGSCSHREYSTGFYFGGKGSQIYSSSSYIRNTDYLGCVKSCRELPSGKYKIVLIQKGPFREGESLEFLTPDNAEPVRLTISELKDSAGLPQKRAGVPMDEYSFLSDSFVSAGSMLRRVNR